MHAERRADDRRDQRLEQAIAVSVTNVNEAPTITSNGGGASAAVNVAENTTAVTTVLLDAGGQVARFNKRFGGLTLKK